MLSFNYYDTNTFTFHFAQFPFWFITRDAQCLQFVISLHMIFYSYSPHLKSICNFAWSVTRLLLVWYKRKISLCISVLEDKLIHTFILIKKTVRSAIVHAENSTRTHFPHRIDFPIVPIILHCAKIWSLSLPHSPLIFKLFLLLENRSKMYINFHVKHVVC